MSEVFRAGYEVEAGNWSKVVRKAVEELKDEIARQGLTGFAIDVDGEPSGLLVEELQTEDEEAGDGYHCPVCGKKDSVFFAEGGTDWHPESVYICEDCEIGFLIGVDQEYVQAHLRG